MPRQIFSLEEFNRMLEKASECRIVRRGNKVKLKLRTARMLYVYVTTKEEADEMLKKVKISVVEF